MMIDPKALRVGNKLQYQRTETLTEIVTVSWVSDDTIGYYEEHEASYPHSANRYSGIPLTSEWLVKLGSTQHYEDQPELWQIGLFVFNLHNQYGLCQWDQEGQCIIFGTVHYKYVHQLQNLHFALTGEELTIKE